MDTLTQPTVIDEQPGSHATPYFSLELRAAAELAAARLGLPREYWAS